MLSLGIACGGSTASPGPVADAGRVDASPPVALSSLVTLTELAAYQVVKIDLMNDGVAVPYYNAPIVARRAGIVRAFVAVPKNTRWRLRHLDAELHLMQTAGEQVLKASLDLGASSNEDSIDSTFDFAIDASTFGGKAMVPYYLVVRDPKLDALGDDIATVRYPADGSNDALRVDASPGSVHIHIVPVRYDVDGSQRLPVTGTTALDGIKKEMLDLYPAREVLIDVGPPLPWASQILADGTGWDTVLQGILDQRAADAPKSDVYYVGLFNPASSFGAYCTGSCILGLATLAGPTDADQRANAVIGFGGYYTQETVAHEIGHSMGRSHAPCGGPAGIDPKFPYSDGTIGVQGYRLSDQSLVPSYTADMMSYCPPEWISDYTYKALATRMTYVNTHIQATAPQNMHFTRISLAGDGTPKSVRDVVQHHDVEGESVLVTYEGATTVTQAGHYFKYDHLPGGYVIAPTAPVGALRVSVPSLSAIRIAL